MPDSDEVIALVVDDELVDSDTALPGSAPAVAPDSSELEGELSDSAPF